MLFDCRAACVLIAAASAGRCSAVDAATQRAARDALLRCASTDRNESVSSYCATIERPARAVRPPEPIDVLVLGEDEDQPAIASAYVLVRPDGLARAGITGSTGWVHERPSPAGEFVLVDPTQVPNEP